MAERVAVASRRVAVLRRVMATAGVLAGLFLVTPARALAQNEPRCVVLCAPELKIEPTWTIEGLGGPAPVEVDGRVEHPDSETIFELVFAVEVPTAVPRVGVTLEAIFLPFGTTDVHPFTGVSAEEAGTTEFRDNGIEIEVEANFHLFDTDQTGGWVSSHVDIVDQFSPGKTPRAASIYTHKLDFEWDTAFHVFNRLSSGNWLRNVELELSLDYLATGLPKAGDVIDGERFVEDENPWSLSFVLVMPLAPLVPD